MPKQWLMETLEMLCDLLFIIKEVLLQFTQFCWSSFLKLTGDPTYKPLTRLHTSIRSSWNIKRYMCRSLNLLHESKNFILVISRFWSGMTTRIRNPHFVLGQWWNVLYNYIIWPDPRPVELLNKDIQDDVNERIPNHYLGC